MFALVYKLAARQSSYAGASNLLPLCVVLAANFQQEHLGHTGSPDSQDRPPVHMSWLWTLCLMSCWKITEELVCKHVQQAFQTLQWNVLISLMLWSCCKIDTSCMTDIFTDCQCDTLTQHKDGWHRPGLQSFPAHLPKGSACRLNKLHWSHWQGQKMYVSTSWWYLHMYSCRLPFVPIFECAISLAALAPYHCWALSCRSGT